MSVLKIVKENKLNIPLGTFLHYTSFSNKVKKDNPKVWDSVGCYIWETSDGLLNIVNQNQIHPDLKDCYINCICLNFTTEFLYEGDEYWKVFLSEEKTRFHKLEFDGLKHSNALVLKPYKDIVQSNTNFMTNDCFRFKTEKDANDYCYKVKNL